MKSRILFVGQLAGLRESLSRMQCQWDVGFCENGQDAMAALSATSFDVVVADMEITGTDSGEFLRKVSEEHPQIIRITLFDPDQQDNLVMSVVPAHQSLSKPCDPEILEAKVGRAFALRRILTNETLTSCISKMTSLPSPPTLYFDIVQELASGNGKTMTQVGELISKDIAMTTKILQLVNSVHYGLRVPSSNPVHAAKMLGPTNVRALVLSSEVFSQFGEANLAGMSLANLLEHSQVVASFAKKIAEIEGFDRNTADEAFLAGLLHDTGKLVLAGNFPARYVETVKLATENDLPLWQAEQEIFGATHAEMGAYLVGLWGIPDAIVETLAFHHRPNECFDALFSILTAVHVASGLEHELHDGVGELKPSRIDEEHLGELGLLERLPAWRERCHEAMLEPSY